MADHPASGSLGEIEHLVGAAENFKRAARQIYELNFKVVDGLIAYIKQQDQRIKALEEELLDYKTGEDPADMPDA